MAISVIRTATNNANSSTPNVTIDATGGNALVICYSAVSYDVPALTFNGASLTTAVSNNAGDYRHAGIAYILNPSQGSYSCSGTTATSATWKMFAIVLSGVKSSSPLGNQNNNANLDQSFTTSTANSIIIDSFSADNTDTLTGPDSGQTGIGSVLFQFSHYGGASYRIATSVGAYNMGWTYGASIWFHVIQEFKEEPAAASNPGMLMMF